MPYGITVLPPTWQSCESHLWPQLKQVLDLANPERCKAYFTYVTWKRIGWELNPWPVNRNLNTLSQRYHAAWAGIKGAAPPASGVRWWLEKGCGQASGFIGWSEFHEYFDTVDFPFPGCKYTVILLPLWFCFGASEIRNELTQVHF